MEQVETPKRQKTQTAISADTVESAAPDKRIVRSKRALKEALVELIEEHGLDGFSVNDLCAKAGLNRGTFYNHFKDKETFVRELEDDLIYGIERFEPRIAELTLLKVGWYVKRKKPIPVLAEILSYLAQEQAFLHAILGESGDPRFIARMTEVLCTRFVKSVLHEQYQENTDAFVEYYIAFYASAYMGVIMNWVRRDMAETPDELAVISQRLLMIRPGKPITL